MISRIIKAEVCVTQTEALIILDIIRKPNSIIACFIIYSKARKKAKPFCLRF